MLDLERPSRPTPSEQFLRRSVKPRRLFRRSQRVALRWGGFVAGCAGAVVAGFWTVAAAGRAPELTVSRIRVEGNHRLADGEILEALGLHPGSNILRVDLPGLKQQLMSSSWVKDVQLTRVLPGTLTLRLVERRPVGVAVLDRLYLIDEEGTFLDEIGPRYRDLALPLVRGIGDKKGRVLRERCELAGKVLATLAKDERLESTVSEIDVSEGAESLRIKLRRPALTILVAEGNLVPRLTKIIPLAEEILQHFPSLEAVDVRFDGRAYLQLPVEASEADVGADGQSGSEGR